MARTWCASLLVVALVVPAAYRPPVDAPVVDGFRPPETPYGPGNRGIDYGTGPGAEVRSAGSGVVVFAGPVGGRLHITVRHPDGLRTSYSSLGSIGVGRGDLVDAGSPIGHTDGPFHFGVRDGDRYLDPLTLFAATAVPEVALVPDVEAPSTTPTAVPGVPTWVRDQWSEWRRSAVVDARLGPWLHYAGALAIEPRMLAVLDQARAWRARRSHCTPASVALSRPDERRLAVLVGGLASSSDEAAIDRLDTGALGYAPADVARFSYRGGTVPARSGSTFAGLIGADYEAGDTYVDLEQSAARLRVLLRSLATAVPGVPIDIVGHSQGGVVARMALIDPGPAGLPATVEHLVTLGSPHEGTDLATAAVAIGADGRGAGLLRGVGRAVGVELDPEAPAITQLAETSNLAARLDEADLADQVQFRSIAARGDLVVPVPRSAVDGSTLAVVPLAGPSAHDALVDDPRAARELALALADRPPGCESLADALIDHATGEAVSWTQDALGLTLAVLT